MYRHGLAAVFIAVALAVPSAALGGPEDPNASCIAHFVHGVPGPPGQFRSEFGSEFPFGAHGRRVSEIAHAEGTTAEECAGITP